MSDERKNQGQLTPAQQVLVALYDAQSVQRDHLPETAEWIQLCDQFNASTNLGWSRHEIWLNLLRLGKKGCLTRKTSRGAKQACREEVTEGRS